VEALKEHAESQAEVSLIILNHNGLTQNREMLVKCIKDAMAVKLYKEVLVVDNGSTDGSVEYIRRNFPEVALIEVGKNLGYSQGMNVGAKRASSKAKYLFFINNDETFSAVTVEKMIEIMERNRRVAIVGAGIWHRDRVYAGSILDVRLTHHAPPKKPAPYHVTAVENFIAVRADVFKSLGGFEPNIFQVYDEADLCIRTWLSGYQVMCDPRLIVYHRHRLPIKRGNPERVLRFMRNKYLIMIKYYDLHYLLIYVPMKILTDIWWSITSPSWRRRRSIIMVFKSSMDILLNYRGYYKRRMAAAKTKTLKIKDLIKMGILLP
jgi:GT2 family glycosyltransferase